MDNLGATNVYMLKSCSSRCIKTFKYIIFTHILWKQVEPLTFSNNLQLTSTSPFTCFSFLIITQTCLRYKIKLAKMCMLCKLQIFNTQGIAVSGSSVWRFSDRMLQICNATSFNQVTNHSSPPKQIQCIFFFSAMVRNISSSKNTQTRQHN